MLTSVTKAVFLVAVGSLLVGVASNRPGPVYLSLGCSAVTLVVLLLWSKLARGQPAQRSTSSQTVPPSESSP